MSEQDVSSSSSAGAASNSAAWYLPLVCGLHDGDIDRTVSEHLLNTATQRRLDLLTTPITNNHFKTRVFELVKLSWQQSRSTRQNGRDISSGISASDPDSSEPPVRVPPLDMHDTSLVPGSIVSQLIGVTSDWIDLCSPDPLVASVSRQVLSLEVQYAAFCGIDHIIIHGPRLYYGDAAVADLPKYARCVQEALDVASHSSFYLKMPMFDHPDLLDHEPQSLETRDEYLDEIEHFKPDELDLFARWEAWNSIRSACKYSNRLFLALLVPMHIPDAVLQARWFSEPVRIAVFDKTAFLEDGRGNLGLSRPSRDFLSRILRLKTAPWVMLWKTDRIEDVLQDESSTSPPDGNMDLDGPTPAEAANMSKKPPPSKLAFTYRCLSYLSWLQHDQPIVSEVERYGTGYQDYLQVPLQPLADNLESMTYEVFEKDPVKYNLYEEAIAKALRDWKDSTKPTSGPEGKVVITVAGAGRGPLVTRAMRASEAEGVPIDLWAVEKNPNAYVLLQKHNSDANKWNGAVHLRQSDMRSWKGPEHPNGGPMSIDILVTELLGSFGDNELSPECLDGILHLLSPSGISIPRSYTALLTPVSAPRIHADTMSRASWEPTASETPAVVWLHSIDYLSCHKRDSAAASWSSKEFKSPSGSVSLPPIAGDPNVLPAWIFKHAPTTKALSPSASNAHNERYARLTFRCRHRGVCHGLGGYFESELYPGVELSTNPNTIEQKSKDMISWFPIFFPLRAPLMIPDNASLTCSVWRRTDDRKVWYEWMVESWIFGEGHRRIRLGQSEMHSSIKSGCLM